MNLQEKRYIDFLKKKIAEYSYRMLKKEKLCAILVGDTRQKGK